MRSISVLLGAILVFTLVCGSNAATYLIRPDGFGDLPTIREAVSAAVDGDVILLTDGVFIGDGNRDIDFLGKAITIQSQGGDPDLCTINCQGSSANPYRGFLFHSDEGSGSILEAITVTGGYASPGIVFGSSGGGVYCLSSSPIFRDCVFLENTAEGTGGGLYCFDSAPRIESCDFVGNHASQGGGIDFDSGLSLAPYDCRFVGNEANNNGGGLRCQRSTANISNCLFEDNEATSGAGLMCRESLCTVTGSLFHLNVSDWYGGAMWSDSDATLTVDGCSLISNYAGLSGGGIHCSHAVANITSCTLYGNSAASGGGIRSGVGATVNLERSIIAFAIRGGGVACSVGGEASLACCDVYGNVDGDWVGCIAGDEEANGNLEEDPMFCDPDSGDFTLHSDSPCALVNNPECGYIGAWQVACGDVTSVGSSRRRPGRITRIFPNPSGGLIEIGYRLQAGESVDLQILDVTGRVVRHLFEGLHPRNDAGEFVLIWDGLDDRGQPVSSGVYVARVRSPLGVFSGLLVRTR